MKGVPTSENYYERLGIPQESSVEEIKKAFFQAVKSYPPEKDPENYKLIREAYDVLNNPVSRDEYDSAIEYGDELRELLEQIEVAKEDYDIEEAIRLAKKVINIAPNVGINRNRLGLLFMEDADYKSAKSQFLKAHKIDPKNPTYLLNLGDASKEEGDYCSAEESYKKAWSLDFEDYVAPRRLAALYYFDKQEKPEAYTTIDKAINADGKVDFQDFFCLYDKLHFLLFDNKEDDVAAHLDLLVNIAKKKEERDFAAYTLSESCQELAKRGRFKMAYKFVDTAREMSNNDWRTKTSQHLHEYVSFDEDNSIVKEVKGLVSLCYYWYWGGIEKKDFDEYIKNAREAVVVGLSTRPISAGIKESFNKLRSAYPQVYGTQQKFFDALLNTAGLADTHYLGPCPHCNKDVRVGLYKKAMYTCPHCSSGFYFNGSSYTTSSGPFGGAGVSYGSSSTGSRNWLGWIAAAVVIGGIIIGALSDSTSTKSSSSSSSKRYSGTTSSRSYSRSSSNYTYLQNLKSTIQAQEARIKEIDAYLNTLSARLNYLQNVYGATGAPQYIVNEYNTKLNEYNKWVAERNRVYNQYSNNIDRYNSSINR